MRLARVGIEDVSGYLEGGVEGWKEAGFPVGRCRQITVQELSSRPSESACCKCSMSAEKENGKPATSSGADWYPLDRFKAALPRD